MASGVFGAYALEVHVLHGAVHVLDDGRHAASKLQRRTWSVAGRYVPCV